MVLIIRDKMKLGILTAGRTNNNGTDIQAYAMQKLFSEYNNDTEIINYICPKLERSHRLINKFSVGNILRIPYRIFNNVAHNRFRKKYLVTSKKVYTNVELCQNDYNMIVVGSDQVWNLDITGNDLSFYLPFKTKTRKISYAASLGRTELSIWDKEFKISSLLNDFASVSVREKSGVEAMRNIGVSARHDLDPILCADFKIWNNITYSGRIPKNYILLYLVEGNHNAEKFAIDYGKKNNLKVISVTNSIRPVKGVKRSVYTGVEKWISYMRNADLIITNSYHGLSFAIANHKNVCTFLLKNHNQSNTRIQSLLEDLNLENTIMNCETCGEINYVDWVQVEKRLEVLRHSSREHIKKLIKKEDKE